MNPYRELRLRAGLTQRQLAQSAGVTEQVVLRTEQGLYTSPSPKLTAALVSYAAQDLHTEDLPPSQGDHPTDSLLAHLSPSHRLESEWHLWVMSQRAKNEASPYISYLRDYLTSLTTVNDVNSRPFNSPSLSPPVTPAWHSLRVNILQLSVTSLAKLLVVQISLLQDLEKTGHNKQYIEQILVNWGIPTEYIDFTVRKPSNAGKPVPLNG